MRKRTFLAAVAALLLLVSCSTDTSAPKQPAQPGQPTTVDRIRLSGNNWGYPSPFTYIRGPGGSHNSLLFDTLIWKDSTGAFLPWLATSWQRSPDGKQWRFTIRDGVRWQDGRPLTADDVAFTFEYLKTGPGGTTSVGLSALAMSGVVVEPPNTVVLTLDRPYAPFEESVAGKVPIMPKHIWSTVTDPGKQRGPEAVMGSGPYKLEQYDEATGGYLYTANEDYFLGRPMVKRLEFVPTGNDFLALERGELDVASTGFAGGSFGAEEGLADAALKPLENARFGQVTGAPEFVRALHFNLTKGFPYNDARFRQAIAYAIDRNDLVKRILFGRGIVGPSGGLAPSNPYAITGLPAYSFDLAKAGSLLDEIGIKDVNGDGKRDLPDGSAFSPELQSNNRYNTDTPVLVKEYLRQVGIDVQVKNLDLAAADDAAAQGRYEMALVAYGGLGADPDGLRTRLSSTVKGNSFQRIQAWNNPQFEQAAAAQLTATDVEQRKALVAQMQRAVADDLPLISLYMPNRVTIFDKSVFDAWYFTPGGVFGAYPGSLNKHVLVTGKSAGF
jgi:peptide/nickel transport system substrate-binding protein